MKPKILVTRAIFPQVIQYLSEHFDVEDNQDDAGYDCLPNSEGGLQYGCWL